MRSIAEDGGKVAAFEKADGPQCRSGEYAVINGNVQAKWGRNTWTREQIDEIDREIVALLNKRAGHSLVIRGLKPGAHLGLYDARREEEIFARVDPYNEGPRYHENLREIYATILKIMKETPSV